MTNSQHYDNLFKEGETFLKKHNPCKIQNGTCLRGRSGGNNFCCSGCLNLSNIGCKVKSLTCQSWLCDEAEKGLSKNGLEDFYKFKTKVDSSGFNVFRGSKKQSLVAFKSILQQRKRLEN